MKLSKDTKILIVGLGLIGGSYADGLTKNGFSVSAIDTSQESLDFALNQGMIKEGQTEPTAAFVGTFDVVIFALYPHAFIDSFHELNIFSYSIPRHIIGSLIMSQIQIILLFVS